MSVDPRWEKVQRVHQAVSASAGDLVPALADIIEDGAWREFLHPMDGLKRYDKFADFCSDTLRITAEAVEVMLDRSSLKSTAAKVRKMLRQDIPVLAANGAIGKGRNRCDNVTPNDRGNDPAYMIARLKRDDPALAEQVVNGELSANAAAIRAGIKRPRAQILVDNPDDAIRGLLKFFTAAQLIASLENLNPKGSNLES
jgi:hypothetical protein